ncbi:MAG TPA: acetoin dehydrogenase dihydrolipoyllysine-residue acetyltransferase subunit, partial [Streptosporangiaceae bacterium]
LIAADDVSDSDLDDAVARARAEIEAGVPDDEDGGAVTESADSGGRRISYAGAGTAGDVVLLIHGFGGDRNSWLFVQQPLAGQASVYALDLPGHGTSAKDVGDGSLDLLADAAVSVLDAIGASRAHLVGHSLGGTIAVAVAARDPGRVASLTLVAPAGFGPEIDAGYLRGFAGAETRRELRPLVGRLFADDGLVTRQVVDDLLAYKRLDGVGDALQTLTGTLLDGDRQRLDAAGPLAALGGAIPVAVIWGADDHIIPASQAQQVPSASRHVVDGAGHMVHMEKPAEVLAAIQATMAAAVSPG